MVEMRRRFWVRLLRAGPVGVVAGFLFAGGALSAQEPTVRAYVEPPEVEVGDHFELKIEVTGVSEVEDFNFQPGFYHPFAQRRDLSDGGLPFAMEITPATAQSAGSVTISFLLVAVESGFFDFAPFRLTADGRSLETDRVLLLVTRPGDTGDGVVRARFEPAASKLMEKVTLIVDAPGRELSLGDVTLPDLSGFATPVGSSSMARSANFDFLAFRPGTHEIGSVSVSIDGEVYETGPLTLVVNNEHGAIEVYAAVNTEQTWVGAEFVLSVETRGVRELDEDPVLPDMSGFAELLFGGASGHGYNSRGYTAHAEYRFHALQSGEFEIGPIAVSAAGQTVRTEPMRLTITAAPPETVVSPERLRAAVSAAKRRVYVGEPVFVTYRVLARDGSSPFAEWSVRGGDHAFATPVHEDFQIHDLGRQRGGWRRITVDGRSYRADTEYLVALMPLEPGEQTIGPAEFRVQVHTREPLGQSLSRGANMSRAGMRGEWTPMTLTTDPIAVEVMPLPAEGRPEPFRGQVGRVEVASWLDRTDAVVGDTVTLRVALSGNAYLRLMPEPRVVLPEGLELSEPEISDDPPQVEPDRASTRTLVYRLVATREGNYRLAAVELPWFDPETAEYGVSRGESFDLTVHPAGRE
ncbi:MAG: protein BatD [Gemmatimonadetes bacterium]|nr:protein BatD [Gemmatimonadota bacterium]MYE70729.1 protein BatD [Gemmatimonadota bacterium]MYJ12462.1 protein BatD [Gemmatimonadota bacterium]